ncbi:MAG: DUF1828 domain-containing protein [Clostridia bacterium]|nr:DUF1828 domain-containing protein [Clostridia bacterium]
MNITDFSSSFENLCNIKPIALNEYEIETTANFSSGEQIKVYLVQENNRWFLSDKKATLKFMNEIYDLKAPDVKHCITAVIKIYGFSIVAGCLRAELADETTLASKFFDYIMCIGQLTNMHAFFDKPE